MLVLVPVTLLANGVGSINGADERPMIVENGCNIGLNRWYIFLTAMVAAKLLLEIWRYLFVKVNY